MKYLFFTIILFAGVVIALSKFFSEPSFKDIENITGTLHLRETKKLEVPTIIEDKKPTILPIPIQKNIIDPKAIKKTMVDTKVLDKKILGVKKINIDKIVKEQANINGRIKKLEYDLLNQDLQKNLRDEMKSALEYRKSILLKAKQEMNNESEK